MKLKVGPALNEVDHIILDIEYTWSRENAGQIEDVESEHQW